jgi:hypothetical protein
MRSLAVFPFEGRFKATGLRSLARLISDDVPCSFIMDSDTFLHVPVELNRQLKKELFMIAERLEARNR